MQIAYQLARQLKTIQSPNNNDRLARAMFLVNAVAYSTPIPQNISGIQFIEDTLPTFKKLVSEINETTPVDPKLCLALFTQALRIRYELVNRVSDPAIISMALRSLTAEDHQNAEQLAMSEWLTSRPEFTAQQNLMSQLIEEFNADTQQ